MHNYGNLVVLFIYTLIFGAVMLVAAHKEAARRNRLKAQRTASRKKP